MKKKKKKKNKKLYIIDDQVRECVYVREKFLNFSLFFFFFCFVIAGLSRGKCLFEKKEKKKNEKKNKICDNSTVQVGSIIIGLL